MRLQLTFLPEQKQLLEIAFSRARKQAEKTGKQMNKLQKSKEKATQKIVTSATYFSEKLQQAVKGFPSMQKIHPFYRELIEATVDLNAMLKALGQMSAARRITDRLKGQYIGKIRSLGKGEEKRAAGLVSEFYGRLASLAKSMDKGIAAYNENAKKMLELPNIRFDLPTAIIAGYPNTGKTTILSRLTKSKPKIAAYPFTTQYLQIGYLIQNYFEFQLIDTPGLLDRPLEKRNKIERKAIAALQHLANTIIFVVDPTTRCGFELEKQVNLFNEIKNEFKETKILIVLNKADIASKEEMHAAKEAFGKETIIEGQGIHSELRGKIVEVLKEKKPSESLGPAIG
jgi:nucleolar GTP-binding protein